MSVTVYTPDGTLFKDPPMFSFLDRKRTGQTGWGGGPNVTLGPQPGLVWGVHSTPASAWVPGTSAVQISWAMGQPTQTHGPPAGKPVKTGSPAAFVPAGVAFSATVSYGLATALGQSAQFSGSNLSCVQYNRPLCNYTSPFLCTVRLYGLQPGAIYQYSIAATVAAAHAPPLVFRTGATVLPGATTFSFRAPAGPSGGAAASSPYPVNWVVMGDPGQSWNTSLTAEFIATYGRVNLGASGGLDMVLNTGDLAYADDFSQARPASVQSCCSRAASAA